MLERLSPLGQHVRDCLHRHGLLRAMGWSSEQIAGRLRLDQSKHIVSHETIYRYIYRPKIRPDKLYRYLPRSKAKRGRRYYKCRREPLSHKRSIHQRPACVEQRIEFGHWEGDLMNFSTLRSSLLTLSERKTRFTLTFPLQTKTADETAQAIQNVLGRLPKTALRTIAFDNGGELERFEKLEKNLGIETYFCDPHSPWQRGSIENTNGILRRDLPRKIPNDNYTENDIHDITWNLNTTPRKYLCFMTPAEVFLNEIQNCT